MDVIGAAILTMLCMSVLIVGVARGYIALLDYGRPKLVEKEKTNHGR